MTVPQLGLPPVAPPALSRFVRVEYVDFKSVDDYREFRFRVSGPEGSNEFRLRIAASAFVAGRVGLQDGPDVCYQKLLRVVADGEMSSAAAITVGDADLVSYREAHTRVPKHRAWTPSSKPPSAVVPTRAPKTPYPQRAVAPPAPAPHVTPPAFGEGQRVRHAVMGVGVTVSSSRSHTVVHFDEGGPKTFVTSLLVLDILSPPHVWETGPRGVNRLCKTPR